MLPPQQFAKHLRQNMTDAEHRLWYHLRAGRFLGLKFKRQKPIGPYIVDFVCLEQRLIIEVDGSQHHQEPRDVIRDRYLAERGFTVLRYWNNEVLLQTEAVLESVRRELIERNGVPFQVGNAAAIERYNRQVDENGVFSDGVRTF